MKAYNCHGHSPRLWCIPGSITSSLLIVMIAASIVVLAYHICRTTDPTVRFYNCVAPEISNSLARLQRDHGRAEYLVPNIVHVYLPVSESEGLSVRHETSLISMYRHQRPDTLVVHTNRPQQLSESLVKSRVGTETGLWSALRVQHWPTPNHVFGLPFSEQDQQQHISDLVRLRILRQYGGIFIDLGVLLTSDLNRLRKHDLVLFKGEDSNVDNSVILAHRDSVVLQVWITSYTHYDPRYPRHHQTQLLNKLFNTEANHNSTLSVVSREDIYSPNLA